MKKSPKSLLLLICAASLSACGGGSSTQKLSPQSSASTSSSISSSSSSSSSSASSSTASSSSSSLSAYVIPTYTPIAAAIPTTGISLPIGKCLNMGNMLEAPNEGEWGRAIVDSDSTKIQVAGFKTVRLPVRFSAHTGSSSPYTIDPVFLARVRHVVDNLTAAGLNVIVDYHFDDALLAAVSSNSVRFTEIWRQVAIEFAGAPASVWFELLNEPNGNATDANLPGLWQSAIAAIRATNPTRPIIVGGQNWSDVNSLATIQIPNDPNIVVTFHDYLPLAYTHQGASWITPVFPMSRKFGDQADANELAAALQTVKDFMTRTGRVPFMGEYGAIETIPLAERANYYKVMTSAFASIGIQSCAWGYINAFPIATDSGWMTGMLEAISTTTTVQ